MRFLRRIYFHKADGEIVHIRMIQGYIVIPTPEQDAEIYPELADWSSGLLGLMEWLTPDPEIEANFKNPLLTFRIDVSEDEPRLIFEEAPTEE